MDHQRWGRRPEAEPGAEEAFAGERHRNRHDQQPRCAGKDDAAQPRRTPEVAMHEREARAPHQRSDEEVKQPADRRRRRPDQPGQESDGVEQDRQCKRGNKAGDDPFSNRIADCVHGRGFLSTHPRFERSRSRPVPGTPRKICELTEPHPDTPSRRYCWRMM